MTLHTILDMIVSYFSLPAFTFHLFTFLAKNGVSFSLIYSFLLKEIASFFLLYLETLRAK